MQNATTFTGNLSTIDLSRVVKLPATPGSTQGRCQREFNEALAEYLAEVNKGHGTKATYLTETRDMQKGREYYQISSPVKDSGEPALYRRIIVDITDVLAANRDRWCSLFKNIVKNDERMIKAEVVSAKVSAADLKSKNPISYGNYHITN